MFLGECMINYKVFVVQILAEKIKSIEDQKLNGMDLNAELDSKTDSFIDRLLKLSLAEGKFSLDDVVSETNTILVAVRLIIYLL